MNDTEEIARINALIDADQELRRKFFKQEDLIPKATELATSGAIVWHAMVKFFQDHKNEPT